MVERVFADGSRIVIVNHPSGTSDVLLQLRRAAGQPGRDRADGDADRRGGGADGRHRRSRHRGGVSQPGLLPPRDGDSGSADATGRCGALDPVRYRGLLSEVRLRNDRSRVHRRRATRGCRGASTVPPSWVAVPAPDRRRHAGGDAALPRQYQTRDRGARPPRRRGRSVGDGAARRCQPGRAKDRTPGVEQAAGDCGRAGGGCLPRARRRVGQDRGLRLVRRQLVDGRPPA